MFFGRSSQFFAKKTSSGDLLATVDVAHEHIGLAAEKNLQPRDEVLGHLSPEVALHLASYFLYMR